MNWQSFVEQFNGLYNYWVVVFLMMTGFYIVIARGNLIKTVIGLNIFQTSVFLLYITMGKIRGGTAPIIPPWLAQSHGHDSHGHDSHGDGSHGDGSHGHDSHGDVGDSVDVVQDAGVEAAHQAAGHATELVYSNPLPSVLMLTAIVVGVATTATALALVVRVREDYGTIDEDEILELDRHS